MTPIILNATPFVQQSFLLADVEGQMFLSVILGATFSFDAKGNAEPAEDQVAVPAGDVPFGQAGLSSLRYDSAATGYKQAVDLILVASAHAPGGKVCTELPVGIRIGDYVKTLLVSGDRDWSGPLGNRPSPARPFLVMPIRYERALGGTIFAEDGRILSCSPDNPVGVGFKQASSSSAEVATRVPNIERADVRVGSSDEVLAPAGFGVVSRNWQPRAAYAGSHTGQWLAERWPLPPLDQDPRIFQCAPADQQFPSALEKQDVVLRNLTPEGDWRFRMPVLDVPVFVIATHGARQGQIRTDTIVIDAEERRVTLFGRYCLRHRAQLGTVREIVLGRPSPGWLRAKLRQKRYLGHSFPSFQPS